MSQTRPPDGVDDEIREMLRAFEGPESPRPGPRSSRPRVGRALLAVTGVAVVVGVVGLAVWALAGEGERREAALSRAERCNELRLDGRRYLARPLSAKLLGRAGDVRLSVVLLCRGSAARRVDAANVPGIRPSAALTWPAVPGTVYVAAASRCLNARPQAQLAACLRARP